MYNNPLITIPRLQHSGNDNWEHHRGMGIAGDWHDDYTEGNANKSWIPKSSMDFRGQTDLGEDSYQLSTATKSKPYIAPDAISSATDYTDSTAIEGSMYNYPKDQKYNTTGVNGALSDTTGVSQDEGNNINVPSIPPADSYDVGGQSFDLESAYAAGEGADIQRQDFAGDKVGTEFQGGQPGEDLIMPDDKRFTKPVSKIGPDAKTADVIPPFLDYENRGAFVSDQFGGWDETRWQQEFAIYSMGRDAETGTGSVEGIPNKDKYSERWSLRGELFHGATNDTPYDLMQAIRNFEASGEVTIEAERAMSVFSTRNLIEHISTSGIGESFRDLAVRKEVIYTDLKNQGASDEFIKKYFGIDITNKMRDDYSNITKDTAVATGPVSMDTQVRAYTQNINKSIAALNAGGLGTSQTDDLISQLSQEVKVPDGYEVVRDETGQPSVKWIGKLTGKSQTIGEGDLMQTIAQRDMTQGRLSGTDEQALNNALQTREQGQVAIQNYIQGKLGLSIDKERAQIVSEEFTQSLNLETDKLTLSRDQFVSNEALSKASLTGVFEDKPTISAQELMAKLTGQVATGGTESRLDESTGRWVDSPIMADTIEMRRLRAELIGQFEGANTITRDQFEAAVFGRIGNNDTFAREQWAAEEARKRNEALLAAGKVVMGNFITMEEVIDPETGKTITVKTPAKTILDSLEKQRLILDNRLADAQINGLRSISVPILDEDGNETGQTEIRSVSYIESQRLVIDQARLDHLMAMEAAAQRGMMVVQEEGEEGEMVDVEVETIAGRKMTLEERQFKAQMEALAGYITTYDAEGNVTGKADTLESVNVQGQLAKGLQDIKLGVDAHERSGLEQMGGPTDSPEGVAYARKQQEIRRTYIDTLNSALSTVTMEETGGLENALAMALPPSPAGMVWDSQGGVFRLRSGFEGRDIDPYTQRELEAVAPILRARDRAERVLMKLQEDKFDFEQAQRIADDQQIRLTNALNNGDIETAEEAAYLKSQAETKLIEQQTKNEKYAMLFQLLQNPVALGMARHYGVLQQIETDLGIKLPHVPTIEGDGSVIPNHSDWIVMTPEIQGLTMTMWQNATGGSPQTFMQLVDQTKPADYNPVEYSIYGG